MLRFVVVVVFVDVCVVVFVVISVVGVVILTSLVKIGLVIAEIYWLLLLLLFVVVSTKIWLKSGQEKLRYC